MFITQNTTEEAMHVYHRARRSAPDINNDITTAHTGTQATYGHHQ